MRKIRATRERSELQRVSQAFFHLLVTRREKLRGLILANCVNGCCGAEGRRTDMRLVGDSTEVCLVVDTFAFCFEFAHGRDFRGQRKLVLVPLAVG
jgi:hypothetical protein